MAAKKIERIQPIRLVDNDTGDQFTLDFTRESVVYAERHGFKVSEVADYLVSGPSDLFYYAFRANHRRVTQKYTDSLLDKMGGLTSEVLTRLIDLYLQVAKTHSIADSDAEGNEKNSSVTVEL